MDLVKEEGHQRLLAREGIGMSFLMCATQSAERPEPGKIRLSQKAINSRLQRVFTPNCKGEYKVPMEIVRQWRSKGKKSLEKVFQSVGFDPDCMGY